MNAALSLPVCFNNYVKLGHMDKSGMYVQTYFITFIYQSAPRNDFEKHGYKY